MGKKVTIASFGLNGHNLWGKTQEEVAQAVLEKIESVRGYHPDLIILPEAFLKIGGDAKNPRWQVITSQLMEELSKKAADMRSYIIASVYEQVPEYPEMRYNSAILIDREGQIAGKYRKVHTVMEETTENLILPSKEYPVFDTDFGRIGIQICFDIGWRDGWQALADQGAQMVVWSAAYDGGNLLNTYAAHHMYFVVSSVRTDHAQIIDPTGRTIAEGARWNGLALATIDLSTTIYHIDRQFQKIDAIRRALGDRVTIHVYSEENIFTIESNDDEWPIGRIEKEFGLMSYKAYHEEATRMQEEWRTSHPTTK